MKTIGTILLALSLGFVGCKSNDKPAEKTGEAAKCAKCEGECKCKNDAKTAKCTKCEGDCKCPKNEK